MARPLFIVNPAAGAHAARSRWEALARVLRNQEGLNFDQIVTTRPGEAMNVAAELAGGYEVVVAVGGDGTILEILSGMLAKGSARAVLAFVPLGTGNDIAKMFRIRTAPEALRALKQGTVRTADVIRIECGAGSASKVSHALSFAGVGVVSDLLKRTTNGMKRVLGRQLAYPAALVQSLWRYRCPVMRVQCDDERFDERFLFACASNSETAGGGMKIAPGALVDDGLLNVNLVQATGRWEVLRHLRRLSQGRHITHPKVHYFTARTVRVETDPPIEVAADGDLIGHTPATLEVRQKAVQVISL